MSRTAFRLITLMSVVGMAVAAAADTITEAGDAGDMPATAQTGGAGAITLITGTLGGFDDADMYAIYIFDVNAFSANTDHAGTAVFDTQLFLFTSTGLGVFANDDIANGGNAYNPRSTLTTNGTYKPAAPGLYYLAISGWDRDPHSAGGPIFTDDTNYTGVVGPTGAGGASPISGWDGNGNLNGGVGAYAIMLTGAQAVPEPGTALLMFATAAAFRLLLRARRF